MCERCVATEEYHEPGLYEIRLKGHLGERWAERFDGLTLSHASDGTTVLFGQVVDQAALFGVLRTLRDLGLPLLSVVYISPNQADGQSEQITQSSEKEETP